MGRDEEEPEFVTELREHDVSFDWKQRDAVTMVLCSDFGLPVLTGPHGERLAM